MIDVIFFVKQKTAYEIASCLVGWEMFIRERQLNSSLQVVMDIYKGIWQKEKWLDSQEVCLLLGISKRALQYYKDQKLLPFSCIHRKNYFKRSDVERLLTSNLQNRWTYSQKHTRN